MYQGIQMDIFIRELKRLLKSVVFKQNRLAIVDETLDIRREADRYMMVKEGGDDFTSYVNFDREVYKDAGVPDQLTNEYLKDKSVIPYTIRQTLINLQRQKILREYIEKNSYYRMLAGQPDISDTTFIYAPDNDFGVSTKIPIHLLSPDDISRLYSSGLLQSIQNKYPTKKYLGYLGEKSISYYKARKALNYELLYNDITDPDNICFDFRKFYSFAREYFMTAIYNPNLANMYKYYDNLIGFFIITMATQRTCAEVFKQGITRDFYDVQLIRYLFNSFNIPFIEEMTMEQMKVLAKNLNIFLRYKSTTKLIFDICTLFGFSNAIVYKYFLVKNHNLDENNKPVFKDKNILNEDGTMTVCPDYDVMYDLYFQKINVLEKDINSAIENPSNRVNYDALTSLDPYWVNDEALQEKIYQAKYNHIETKYISLDLMFKITEMMYEVCHTFRMIIDNNEEFRKVTIDIPRISFKPQDLYSVIVFLCALFCKRYTFAGEIPLKPESVAYVYGFNFSADLNKIRNDILTSDKNYIDKSVVNYMVNFNVNTSKDVSRIYNNIKDLKDFIVERMAETKDIDAYRAYKALYKSTLIVQDKETVYKKSNGDYAKTYNELLEDINPELHTFLQTLEDKKEINLIFEHVLYKLEDMNSKYKYLHLAVESEGVFNIVIKLITFFKSYTVDLASAGILYLFNDRFFNMLKLLDKINSIEVKMDIKTVMNILYLDLIKTMEIDITEKDRLILKEMVESTVFGMINNRIFLKDEITMIQENEIRDSIISKYSDNIQFESIVDKETKMKLFFKMGQIISDIFNKDYIGFNDRVNFKAVNDIKDKLLTKYSDIILSAATDNIDTVFKLSSKLGSVLHNIITEDSIEFKDIIKNLESLYIVKDHALNVYSDTLDSDIDTFNNEIIKVIAEITDIIVDTIHSEYYKINDRFYIELEHEKINNLQITDYFNRETVHPLQTNLKLRDVAFREYTYF